MKVRIIGNVKHDGVLLSEYEVYDLPEKEALALIEAKNAKPEPTYPDKKVADYIPHKVKVDPQSGMRIPGESVAAVEPKGKGIKGVESSQDSVKGDDEDGKKQEQTSERKEETEEK